MAEIDQKRGGVSWTTVGMFVAMLLPFVYGAIQLGAVQNQVTINTARLGKLEDGFIENRQGIVRLEADSRVLNSSFDRIFQGFQGLVTNNRDNAERIVRIEAENAGLIRMLDQERANRERLAKIEEQQRALERNFDSLRKQ